MNIIIENPLAEYVEPEEHREHARVTTVIAAYHYAKANAMECRLDGSLPQTIKAWDDECEMLAQQIEKATS